MILPSLDLCGSFPDSTSSLPVTGLFFPAASTDETADYMPPSLQEEVIEALETDEQVTGKAAREMDTYVQLDAVRSYMHTRCFSSQGVTVAARTL